MPRLNYPPPALRPITRQRRLIPLAPPLLSRAVVDLQHLLRHRQIRPERPRLIEHRAQVLPKIAEVLKGIDPQPTNDVDLARKDLRTMLDEARSLGANLPVAEKVLEIYDRAANEGWGARDQTTLASYWPRRGKG